MATNDSSELSAELLNDFYAECDEHLNIVRQALTALEQKASPEETGLLIEKLFRSFHSLKGIIGMVGIASAEQLAHRTEDYLRELSRRNVQLNAEGLDLLANSAHLLEQTVAAYREKQPMPVLGDILARFDAFLPSAPTSPEAKSEAASPPKAVLEGERLQRKIEEIVAKGFPVWKCTFVPTTALNEKGVNVSSIRERLVRYGEIIHSAPHIGGGTIAFEFLLAASEIPSNFEEWQKEGVSFAQLSAVPPGTPKAAPIAPQTPSNLFVAPSQFVRVELGRLDELMRVTGELVVQRARLEEQIARLAKSGADPRGLQEVNLGFGRHFKELRETVMRLRMVPIAEIFDRLPFVVRDLTRGTKKKVRLEVRGQQTELDKYVVEQLKDPLLHLVRNALSHGIEEPEERIAAGKPAEATLTLSAKAVGETVIIEISDDGRGIDRARVIARATELGVPLPEQLDDSGILELICRPGFSTRDEADRSAGRGVGMDVVTSTLQELGGNMSLHSEPGKNTRFTLRLPLTLLITEALIVSSGDQQYAIPQSSVEEVLQIEEKNVKRMERAELVSVRGSALPLVRLRGVFGFGKSDRAMPSVLVSQSDRGRVGLVVDRIIGQRQIVVRSIRDPLIHVPGVIGATELGDGRPLLILDPIAIARHNGNLKAEAAPEVRKGRS